MMDKRLSLISTTSTLQTQVNKTMVKLKDKVMEGKSMEEEDMKDATTTQPLLDT